MGCSLKPKLYVPEDQVEEIAHELASALVVGTAEPAAEGPGSLASVPLSFSALRAMAFDIAATKRWFAYVEHDGGATGEFDSPSEGTTCCAELIARLHARDRGSQPIS